MQPARADSQSDGRSIEGDGEESSAHILYKIECETGARSENYTRQRFLGQLHLPRAITSTGVWLCTSGELRRDRVIGSVLEVSLRA